MACLALSGAVGPLTLRNDNHKREEQAGGGSAVTTGTMRWILGRRLRNLGERTGV